MVFRIKSIFGASSDNSTTPVEQQEGVKENSISDSVSTVETEVEDKVQTSTKVIEEKKEDEVPNDAQSEEASEEISEEAATENAPVRKYPSKRKPRNFEDLILELLPDRSKFASDNLKSILTGTLLFEILPIGKKYFLTFNKESSTPCAVKECLGEELDNPSQADCSISIHGRDLMRIADGDLNPQILMLSHKLRVSGNTKLATYIFNLLAPQNNF